MSRSKSAFSSRVKYKILLNSAKCLCCGDVLVSTHRHDFVACSCGAIFVDGGHDYLRRGGNMKDIEELSESEVVE